MARATFSQRSRLDASAGDVWARVITPQGINHEMRPWMRMTIPAHVDSLDPEHVTLGERIGRSWLLLFGFLPIDFDDVTLVELEPGRRFLERSPMGSMRHWEHERTVEAAPEGGCLLTDRITMEPRLPFLSGLLAPVIRWFFRHRHSKLRGHFGGAPA